jgi:predicted TIM-barrel fold metal-dependent hydrolase
VFVVDAHTHIFPDEVLTGREVFCGKDEWFGQLYANPRNRLIAATDLIESMDASRIDHAIVCGFPWRDAGLCDLQNDIMRSAAARFPRRLSWLGIISPGHGNRVEAVTAELLARGAAGIGELNADAQGFDLRQPGGLREAFAVCAAARKPVMLHASEPVGHDYPGKGTATPEKLVAFASAFPDLPLVAAHWGGGLPFYELMPEVRDLLRNVSYDSAASTYLYDAAVFRAAIAAAGMHKVLFASDFPILRQDRFHHRVSSLEWTSDAERSAVMSGNAARVYGIGIQEQTPG